MNSALLHPGLFPRKFWHKKSHTISGEKRLNFLSFLCFRGYFGMYFAGPTYPGGSKSIVTRLPATFRPSTRRAQLPKTTLSPLMGVRVWSSVSKRGGQTETIGLRKNK